MTEDHRPAADGAAPSYPGATGDADTAGQRAMRSDMDVVADLDLIVELDAVCYHGVVEGAAIYGGIGTDLDVVADDDAADLRDLEPGTVALSCEAEAVCPYHCTRVHNRTAAYYAVGIYADIGIKLRISADDRTLADDTARTDLYAFADDTSFTDKSAGRDTDAGGQLRFAHGSGMAAGRSTAAGIQPLGDAGEIKVGLIGYDAGGGTIGGDLPAQNDGPSPGDSESGAVFWVSEEADIVGTGAFKSSDLNDQSGAVAYQFTAEAGNDLVYANGSQVDTLTWRRRRAP